MNHRAVENAETFLEQLEDVKAVDVGEDRLKTFTTEDDFNSLSVELLIEVGSYVCIAGNLLPVENKRWRRNEAILGGHLVRLYKLISALLDQVCQRRREITFIIARLIFECIVNLRFLILHADDPDVFDSYIAYSLKQEKRLHERIHANIEKRGGEILPVEKRMLASIARVVAASNTSIEALSSSRPKEWADKNLFQRAGDVGLDEVYLGTFGGPSASIHGNWMDLLGMHLEPPDDEIGFKPSFSWTNPRPQIADTTALLAVDAVREYFQLLFENDSSVLDNQLKNLSDRIRRAMEAHEAFLIKTGAT